MAEKKATRCLRVALTPGTENLPSVKANLIDKGHDVYVLPELTDYDLVIGPNAHRMAAFNEKLLPLVVKSARLRVYGKVGNKRRAGESIKGDLNEPSN